MKTTWFASVLSFAALNLLPGTLARDAGTNKDFTIVKRNDVIVEQTAMFGEPHGSPIIGRPATVLDGIRIFDINLSGCGPNAHLDYIGITFRKAIAQRSPKKRPLPDKYIYTYFHAGGSGGGDASIRLRDREYVKQIDLTTYQAKTGFMHKSKRTRIGSITFTTSENRILTCGAKSDKDNSISWHFDKHAFLYFGGSSGTAIDALYGTFVPVDDYFK